MIPFDSDQFQSANTSLFSSLQLGLMASATLLIENGPVQGSPRGGDIVGALVHLCIVVEMSLVVIVGVVVVVVEENLILEAWVNDEPLSTTKNGFGGMGGHVVSGDR
ncbi:hypothetical protein L6452_43690 [Arctium lappa]|uniref:Uncharacterized protein n=1 Tax=Arctium lappa TaxID=4217 RepID=A0ACB8XE49_ARCLA|nr:hypothetical protein L6452_43690 [Arctium lappa]